MKTIAVNGTQLAYLEEGEGPLVVLCHGFPDTAHTWDRVRPALARAGYRAVSPFMRGYAPSIVPPDGRYDSDTLGCDVLALIDALGGPAIVVGHDWGASAVFSAAGLGPDKIRLLITMAIPHPAAIRPSLSLMWSVRHFVTLRLPGAADRARANDFALIDELVARWSPGWDVPPAETDAVKRAFSEPGCLEAALGYYEAMTLVLPKSQRRRVEVDAVAFAGLHDIIAPEQYDRAAKRYDKRYEVVRVPGGHFMHRQHPDDFERELLRVLREHEARSDGETVS